MKRVVKKTIMTVLWGFVLMCGCAVKLQTADTVKAGESQRPIVFVRDTPKVKKPQVYDSNKINAIINRLPGAMDRLEKVSDKVDGVSNQFSEYIKLQAVKDSQFNIMFNVANARRKQIASMKADSVRSEIEKNAKFDSVLKVMNKMSNRQESLQQYKHKDDLERRISTWLMIFFTGSVFLITAITNWPFKRTSHV